MHFNGRWVPTELVYTIFFGWIVVVAIIVAAYFRLKHTCLPRLKPGRDPLTESGRKKKRSERNKRYR